MNIRVSRCIPQSNFQTGRLSKFKTDVVHCLGRLFARWRLAPVFSQRYASVRTATNTGASVITYQCPASLEDAVRNCLAEAERRYTVCERAAAANIYSKWPIGCES